MDIKKIVASIPTMNAKQRVNLRKNADAQLSSAKESMSEAAASVLAALDDFDTALPKSPLAQRIVNAFSALPASKSDAMIIQALIDNPGSTTEALSAVCGWEGDAWHLHFGKMCEKRSSDLGPALKSKSRKAEPFASGRLAAFDFDAMTFTMLADAEAVFLAIGVATPKP